MGGASNFKKIEVIIAQGKRKKINVSEKNKLIYIDKRISCLGSWDQAAKQGLNGQEPGTEECHTHVVLEEKSHG